MLDQSSKGLCQNGLPIPGEPPLLKTRIHLRRDAAEELWKELRCVGWQPVDPCSGAFVESWSCREGLWGN